MKLDKSTRFASFDEMEHCRLLIPFGLATIAVVIVLSGPETSAQTLETPQSRSIQVTGTVRNSVGNPIPGASVRLEEKDGKGIAETETDGDGHFLFSPLHPDQYTLRITKATFREAMIGPVALSEGDAKHFDVVLQVSSPQRMDSAGRLPPWGE